MRQATAPLPWRRLLVCGVTMGVAGDLLLRAEDVGLNIALLFLGVAAGIFVTLAPERRWEPENLLLLGLGIVFGATTVLRDSPSLNALSFVAASATLALVGLRGGRPWLARAGLSDVAESLGSAAAHAGLGSIRLAWEGLSDETIRGSPAGTPESGRWGGTAVLVRGIAIALPFLLVFGTLLLAADPVYAEILERLVRIDLTPVLEHVVPIVVLGWLATGYFAGVWTGTRVEGLTDQRLPRSIVGAAEVGVAIALVDFLFLSFVIVQIRYLFGGAELVQITPGLTYAEYARQGAFQLAFCTALAIPSLLLADWCVGPSEDAPAHRRLVALAGAQILLLLVVLTSAYLRLRVYRDVYGLTVSRIYAAALLAWLGVVALAFVGTVLRGRRERFVPIGLAAAAVTIGALVAWNPEAAIVRANVEGASTSADAASSLDVAYLANLSSDAVPPLLDSLGRLPEVERCAVALQLLNGWGPDAPRRDPRAWDLSTARARRAVAAAESRLRELSQRGCEPG